MATLAMQINSVSASTNELEGGDIEEIVWFVIEALADEYLNVGNVISVIKNIRDSTSVECDDDLVPNPYFVKNKIGGYSPKTKKYLQARRYLQFGSSLFSLGGKAASVGTANVDIAGALQAANAMGSTATHMVQLKQVAERYAPNPKMTAWLDCIQKAKGAKMTSRSLDLAGAVIPGADLPAGVAALVARLGAKVTLGKLVARTAMEVHWNARRECPPANRGGVGSIVPQGPASAIMHEIFLRRGFTRIFGEHDVASLIQEPGGWMALNDKLMLM